MEITKPDLTRLLAEIRRFEENDSEVIEKWFESHEFSEDAARLLQEMPMDGFGALLDFAIQQHIEEAGIEPDRDPDNPQMRQLPNDIFTKVIYVIGVSMFTLGWETHHQFRGGA